MWLQVVALDALFLYYCGEDEKSVVIFHQTKVNKCEYIL